MTPAKEFDLSLPDALQLAFQRMGTLEVALLELIGEVRAARCAFDALAITHAAPGELFSQWQRMLPALSEELIPEGVATSEHTLRGWQKVLMYYSEYFEVLKQRADAARG
ncbi:MAG: hypothetical protein JSR26_03995 [Proteobacteria bacterium]|nr:hypothetical protein [Pseudomonadota bacterium]